MKLRVPRIAAAVAFLVACSAAPPSRPAAQFGLICPPGFTNLAGVHAGLKPGLCVFTPKALPGLRMWLRGDMGVTKAATLVTNWTDQSGFGNNASQATGALQPTFNATSIGGKPGLTFSGGGSGTYLTGTTNVLPTNSPRTVFVVMKASSGTGGTLISFRRDASQLHVQAFYSGSTLYWMGDQTTNTQVNGVNPIAINGVGAIAVWSIMGPSTLPLCLFNGTSYGTTGSLSSTLDGGASGFTIGNREDLPAIGQAWGGEIDEVIVYNYVLTGNMWGAVNVYLKARYGL